VQLTELRLVKLSVAALPGLQALPAGQLQALCLSVSPNIHGWQRKQLQPQLGYLTALTRLSCTGERLFAVQAHDALPPALRALTGRAAAAVGQRVPRSTCALAAAAAAALCRHVVACLC
jgi:hypothetical protein